MKLSKLATALAIGLASVGAAQAAIAPTSPGSELFFVAFGDTNDATFVYDLGISITDFGIGSTNAQSNLTFNLNGQGQSFSSFLAANPDAKYGVFAVDGQGSVATPGNRTTLTTSTQPASTMTFNNSILFAQQAQAANNFVNATNLLPSGESTHGSQANGASSHVKTGPTDNASFDNNIGLTFNLTATNWQTMVDANQTATFASLRNGSTADTPQVQQFLQAFAGGGLSDVAAFWDIEGSTLTWNGVNPIPEPSEYAFMLAGLSLAAAIARRRKKAA